MQVFSRSLSFLTYFFSNKQSPPPVPVMGHICCNLYLPPRVSREPNNANGNSTGPSERTTAQVPRNVSDREPHRSLGTSKGRSQFAGSHWCMSHADRYTQRGCSGPVDAPLLHYSEFRNSGKDSKNADSSNSNSLSDRRCSQRLSDKADPDSPGIYVFSMAFSVNKHSQPRRKLLILWDRCIRIQGHPNIT